MREHRNAERHLSGCSTPSRSRMGPLVVRWYGHRLRRSGSSAPPPSCYFRWRSAGSCGMDARTTCLPLMVCAIVGVMLGATHRIRAVLRRRLLLVPSRWRYSAFNQGGMSFHGGLVGALLSAASWLRVSRGIPYLTLADLGCIAAPIGLFFGRCANFVNGELWGAPTDGPLGRGVRRRGGHDAAASLASSTRRCWRAIVIVLRAVRAVAQAAAAARRARFWARSWCSTACFRFLIEFVREPDVQLGYLWGGWLTMGQVLSAPLIVAGIALLIYAARTRHPRPTAGDSAAVCPWRCGLGAPSGFLVTTWCHPALRKSGWHSFQYNISRLRTARLRLFVTSSYKRYEVEHGREILQVHALRQHCR